MLISYMATCFGFIKVIIRPVPYELAWWWI